MSPARRSCSRKIDEMPRLKLADLEWNGPIDIDRLEWMASAADLCRLLAWLDAHGGETAQAIMAVNSGKAMPAARFSYVGYKGGSEAGVLSMSWLLHARDGKRYAMSAIWNNTREAVDLEKFVGLMSAAGDFGGAKPLKVRRKHLYDRGRFVTGRAEIFAFGGGALANLFGRRCCRAAR